MAKKTNKTEHVLSLLSGTDAAVEKDEKKENDKKHLHTKCVRDNIST